MRTDVTTSRGESETLEYAVAYSKGACQHMKDAHRTILELDFAATTSFFGVFDGEGGHSVSKFCAKNMPVELLHHGDFISDPGNALTGSFLRMDELMKEVKGRKELRSLSKAPPVQRNFKDFITRIFKAMKPRCVSMKDYPEPLDEGSSACVVLVRGDQIIVANAGSCRCIMAMHGQAFPLSSEHALDLLEEKSRVQSAGLEVRDAERGMEVSRCIGFTKYKDDKLSPEHQLVTSCPEVIYQNLNAGPDFLVLGPKCLWKSARSNKDIFDYVSENLTDRVGLESICEGLLKLTDYLGGHDGSSTVIIVRFKRPRA